MDCSPSRLIAVSVANNVGSCPLLVIYHSGIAWHPAGFSLIYLHNPCVTTLMLWGHGRAVAPETTSMEKESAFVSTPATTVLTRLLPDATLLRLEACDVDDTTAQITLRVQSTQTRAPCPLCATPARRIHSDYGRTLADLPWARIGSASSCVSANGFVVIATAAAVSSPNGCPPSRPPGRGARCGSLSA